MGGREMERYRIIESLDNGYLAIKATDTQRLGEMERLNIVIQDLENKGYKVAMSYEGLAGICYGLALRIKGVNSFMGKFVTLFHDPKGWNDGYGPTFTKQGNRIIESKFDYKGVAICYDGDGRQAYIDSSIVLDWLDKPLSAS